ncbi:MAG: hypothetical protein ACO1QR_05360 [Chthoniobacteraceae bacterium]
MKTEFLKPRFDGPRFELHTLPVEVARDLAAYEELVIQVAKHLYLRKHEGRQRVPKGFEKEFSLHLERVDEGSARPLLAWVAAAGLLLAGGGHAAYFEEARDVIAECVRAAAEDQPLPSAFPRELLEYFNVVGRSLRDGESLDLAPEQASRRAVLNPERRKKLVLAVQKTYLREVEIAGQIDEVDWSKQTFRIRLEDGAVATAPFHSTIEALVREAAGIVRTRVNLRGVGVFDAYDKLQRVSTTDHLEISPNHALGGQLEALGNLSDGWIEGSGKSIEPAELEWIADQITGSFPADLPFPFVCATPTGGVFLEWSIGEWVVSAEFPLPERRCELQATNTETSSTTDEDLVLEKQSDFAPIYQFVRRFI